MPIRVVNEIKKKMRQFLREKFDCWNSQGGVVWDFCCRPKDKGGLSIGRLAFIDNEAKKPVNTKE